MKTAPEYAKALRNIAAEGVDINGEVIQWLRESADQLDLMQEALEAIYADGKGFGGAGEAYGLVISHQSIARRALRLTPPF